MSNDPFFAERTAPNPHYGYAATTVQDLYDLLGEISRLASEKEDGNLAQLVARVWRPNNPLLHSIEYNRCAIDSIAKNYQQHFYHERRPGCEHPTE